MGTDNQVNQVGQLHMQLSDLESKLEKTEKEGHAMAEHLKAIAVALEPPEVYIYNPILFANDEVFSIAGYKAGGMVQRVGLNEFFVAPYPNVKELVKRIYDLRVEKDKVKKELKDAEGRARQPRP